MTQSSLVGSYINVFIQTPKKEKEREVNQMKYICTIDWSNIMSSSSSLVHL